MIVKTLVQNLTQTDTVIVSADGEIIFDKTIAELPEYILESYLGIFTYNFTLHQWEVEI